MIYSLPYLSVSSAIKRLQYILTIEVLSRVFPPTSRITKESNHLLDMRKLSSYQGSIAQWATGGVRQSYRTSLDIHLREKSLKKVFPCFMPVPT